MAREPQITRTIKTTNATVMCLDTVKGEAVTKTFTLPRTYKDEKHILKAIEKMNADETVKPVHVVSTEEAETLYGMTEKKFVELAEVMPAREKNAETANA